MPYLTIDLDFIEKNKQKGLEETKDLSGETTYLTLSRPDFRLNEVEYEDGELSVSGTLIENKSEIYFSIELNLSQEIVAEIIAAQVKKMNQIKNILESASKLNIARDS